MIAHSQGNIFADQAYKTLTNIYNNSLSVIGVASASNDIRIDTPYQTAHDDRVINYLRSNLGARESNIENDLLPLYDYRDTLNHNFDIGYFRFPLPSRKNIDYFFWKAIEETTHPEPQVKDGLITATLTWGEEPDVDLHVIEPMGNMVFYGNRVGDVGELDVDDTSSYGPEHYYARCDSLLPGKYVFGVNYFKGNKKETAELQIKLDNAEGVST
ncbi:hypothetical protein L0B53_05165 [Vibrio sp. SS-MA-C1-2]|uniref:YfaP family protein n=1 Tax=Vibrio sp. SS-MA-C1-2 TaxID=2908646 RepID=UPI001F43C791|nr:hypothetical protein [Vibrio sp. SS-MA-C1-2]UJF18993.1 hypothetical protein L0B53_05165 [Vibrio sp. SS-MA-C1-2]